MEKLPFFTFLATKTGHQQETKPAVPKDEKFKEKCVVSTRISLCCGDLTQIDHKANGCESSSSSRNRKRSMVPESTVDVASLIAKNNARRVVEEVSTELTLDLSSQSSVLKKRKIITGDDLDPEEERIREARMIEMQTQRVYSYQDEQEERRLCVSTRLNLKEDPWKIKKKLTRSDVDGSCRLLLGKELVQKHILPFLDDHHAQLCSSLQGLKVIVLDINTGTGHQLVLKTWPGTSSSVLTSNWKLMFVKRRDLKVGDEIGLFWDRCSSRFYFSVLMRSFIL